MPPALVTATLSDWAVQLRENIPPSPHNGGISSCAHLRACATGISKRNSRWVVFPFDRFPAGARDISSCAHLRACAASGSKRNSRWVGFSTEGFSQALVCYYQFLLTGLLSWVDIFRTCCACLMHRPGTSLQPSNTAAICPPDDQNVKHRCRFSRVDLGYCRLSGGMADALALGRTAGRQKETHDRCHDRNADS